ncbi:MAG TPA: hypothetical protein VGA34_04485 [Alteraurantiacibacter sp.]|jgi:hypothetical protein
MIVSIILAAVAISIFVFCYLAVTAPAGREDEQGWHRNDPVDHEDRE